jgi:hypothetical protein
MVEHSYLVMVWDDPNSAPLEAVLGQHEISQLLLHSLKEKRSVEEISSKWGGGGAGWGSFLTPFTTRVSWTDRPKTEISHRMTIWACVA